MGMKIVLLAGKRGDCGGRGRGKPLTTMIMNVGSDQSTVCNRDQEKNIYI